MKMYRIVLGNYWRYHLQKRVILFGVPLFWKTIYKTDTIDRAKNRMDEQYKFPIYGDDK